MSNQKHFEAQAERRFVLAEESSEVIQALQKLNRFTENSVGYDNVGNLEREVGQVMAILSLMFRCGDINPQKVSEAMEQKIEEYKTGNRLLVQDPDTLKGLRSCIVVNRPKSEGIISYEELKDLKTNEPVYIGSTKLDHVWFFSILSKLSADERDAKVDWGELSKAQDETIIYLNDLFQKTTEKVDCVEFAEKVKSMHQARFGMYTKEQMENYLALRSREGSIQNLTL